METATLTLERKFAAWLKGKDDHDAGRDYEPPRWVKDRNVYLIFYRAGYDGENYFA
jgi:hypothetical protein